MKNAPVVFAIALISLSCSQGKYGEVITVDESSKIIDVRTAKEYRQGHLKNAINIPHKEIRVRIADHVRNKEDKITVYCRSGRRSRIAKKVLENLGYKDVVNAGAYARLKKQEDRRDEREKTEE